MKLINISSKELKQKSGVYKLSICDHIYIGSSKDLYQRLSEHRRDLRNNAHTIQLLQQLVNETTLENVEVEILEYCESNIRLFREQEWIKKLNADLNGQDPVTHELNEKSKKKLSESVKKGRAAGKYKQWHDKSPIEMYDYFGDFIAEFSSKEEAACTLGISQDRVRKLAAGYQKGLSLKGIRLRYKDSKCPVKKFDVVDQYLGKYFDFYYINELGQKELAFHDVRDLYPFMAKQLRNKNTQIVLYPEFKNPVNLGKASKEVNPNPSISEME